MSEYGYIPEAPEQSFGNNKGIFNPKDIYDLTRADKYTNYGQLELIETQTVSSAVAQVDFTSLQESKYNVHFITVNDIQFSGTNIGNLAFRFFESGVLESGNAYDIAYQRMSSAGTFTETKAISYNHLRITTASGNGGISNGYSYFYNLGDSTKYSFHTMHNTLTLNGGSTGASQFGSGVMKQASVVDGIRFFDSAASQNIANATFSLYGIKEYS